MAAPIWQSSSKGGTTSTSIAIVLPTGTTAGDLLSIWLHSDTSAASGGATFGLLPSGATATFSALTSNPGSAGGTGQHVLKLATSGDVAAGTLSFTRTGGTGAWGGIIDRITGVDTSSPIDVFATAVFNSVNEGSCPSVTTTDVDRLVFHYTTWDEGKTFVAQPSGDTLSQTNLLSSNAGGSAFFTLASPGATGTGQWDISSGTRTVNATVAFKEPSAVGVTGSMNAVEVGSDGLSGSGSVLVSGAFSAQEAGSDVLAASGAASVSGSLSAVETGQDAFSAAGIVTNAGAISGSMSAMESGSDAFSAIGDNANRVTQSTGGGGFYPAQHHSFTPVSSASDVRRIERLLFPKRKKPKKKRIEQTVRALEQIAPDVPEGVIEREVNSLMMLSPIIQPDGEREQIRMALEAMVSRVKQLQDDEETELLLLAG